jgi:hypothetical protein
MSLMNVEIIAVSFSGLGTAILISHADYVSNGYHSPVHPSRGQAAALLGSRLNLVGSSILKPLEPMAVTLLVKP